MHVLSNLTTAAAEGEAELVATAPIVFGAGGGGTPAHSAFARAEPGTIAGGGGSKASGGAAGGKAGPGGAGGRSRGAVGGTGGKADEEAFDRQPAGVQRISGKPSAPG